MIASNVCDIDTFEFVIDVTTNTSDYLINSLIKIYPNPVRNELQLQGLDDFDIQEIFITDVASNVLFHQEQINSLNHQIDFSGYAKGVYFLKILDSKGRIIRQKLIHH